MKELCFYHNFSLRYCSVNLGLFQHQILWQRTLSHLLLSLLVLFQLFVELFVNRKPVQLFTNLLTHSKFCICVKCFKTFLLSIATGWATWRPAPSTPYLFWAPTRMSGQSSNDDGLPDPPTSLHQSSFRMRIQRCSSHRRVVDICTSSSDDNRTPPPVHSSTFPTETHRVPYCYFAQISLDNKK